MVNGNIHRREVLRSIGASGAISIASPKIGNLAVANDMEETDTVEIHSGEDLRQRSISALESADVRNVLPNTYTQPKVESSDTISIHNIEFIVFSEGVPKSSEPFIDNTILSTAATHYKYNNNVSIVLLAIDSEEFVVHRKFDDTNGGKKTIAQYYEHEGSKLIAKSTSINGEPPKPVTKFGFDSEISPQDHDDDYPWPGDDCDPCHGCHGAPPGAPNGRYMDAYCNVIDWDCMYDRCETCVAACGFGGFACFSCIILYCGTLAWALCCEEGEEQCVACATGTNPNCD